MSLLNNAGLGKRILIENWLTKINKINTSKFKLNDDLTIDFYGYLELYSFHLENGELPPYIQFNKVCGYFDCSSCKLKSLRGVPYIVEDYFACSHNNLETLDYMPKQIGGSIFINHNKIKELKNIPKIIQGGFNCACNKLTSLKGCPDEIYGQFNCSYNDIRDLSYRPTIINGSFYGLGTPKMFTKTQIGEFYNLDSLNIII